MKFSPEKDMLRAQFDQQEIVCDLCENVGFKKGLSKGVSQGQDNKHSHPQIDH